MLGKMTGGNGRRPGGQPKSWHRCLLGDLKGFDVTKGSTEQSKFGFGVEAGVWTIAAKNAGKWYRGVLEAAERLMAKWHENKATLSRNHHASATGGAQGNRKGGRNSRRETAVDVGRKEVADRVAPTSGHLPRLPAPQTAAGALNAIFLCLGFVGTLSVRSCFYL